MDPEPEKEAPPVQTRKDHIRSLLLRVGGLEEILRMSISEGDHAFQKSIEGMKKEAYKELKRVVNYGPEE